MSSLADLEILFVAIRNLKQQQLRSFLTLIGIVIGIAAIVALVALGQGLNLAVQRQFEAMGSNTLIVVPGKTFIQAPFSELQEDDHEKISNVKGVEFATPIYMVVDTITRRGNDTTSLVFGFDPKDQEGLEKVGMLSIGEGRELSIGEKSGILVGKGFSEDAFEDELNLKERVEIQGKSFRVVGIAKETGNSFGAMFDRAVVMNYESLKDIDPAVELTPARVMVKVFNEKEIDDVIERITKVLDKSHGDEDFMIITPSTIGEIMGSVLGIIQLVLVGLAAISLFVGGIGIMNTMFMSVLERTREIGLMKAIGATNSRVLSLFLMEAGFIGMVGGTVGIIFGYSIAMVVSIVASLAGFDLIIVPDLTTIAGVLFFSMFVGMVSGFIPARNASLLDPVEALRFR